MEETLNEKHHAALLQPPVESTIGSRVYPASSSACVLIVARHGERLDAVTKENGGNWLVGQERPFDTPLTEHGLVQARKLGEELADKIELLKLPPISAVYSSPFLRCRQTATAARRAIIDAMDSRAIKGADAAAALPLIRVESGLSESINESWYQSWSLPGSDGSWGFGSGRGSSQEIDPASLHSLAKRPVQQLLVVNRQQDIDDTDIDLDYNSKTSIDVPFCFHPRLLESKQDQRDRMRETVATLIEPSRTILFVSHGGPVTHLYEDLTGNNWQVHGGSSYCCYTIYRQVPHTTASDGDDNANRWEALVVNESRFLHESLAKEEHV
ncbi:hypothetical protein MPSEU_001066000 [Mayamaea pseudoterrestris]|nr:hypothetical protein MPSEU_001066000 [Mayamaea pseudoterrestris]